ncbi:MAG: GTP 3',8-cyclase MoaA [Fusobacteriaceae bacterium]
MKDKFGREIDYLRISLTEKCNIRCLYCMPDWKEKISEEKSPCKITQEELSKDEIIEIVEIFSKIGIKKIRLTGGEPLIRQDLLDIVGGISKIANIEEVCLTTNGLELERKIEDLKKAGLNRINISLDTLDPDEYRTLTRGGDVNKVLKAIEKCLALDIPVKVNAVITNVQSEESVQKLAELSVNKKIDVRFIEIMPIGLGKGLKGFTGDEIVKIIMKKYDLQNLYTFEGTSKYYKIQGGRGRIGFINPMSECFCGSCNRVRITSSMELKTCLSSEDSLDLKEVMNRDITLEEKKEIILSALYNRNEKNIFNSEKSEKKTMNQIGG